MLLYADQPGITVSTEDMYKQSLVRSYLETRPGRQGDVTDELVEEWFRDVVKAATVSFLCISILAECIYFRTITGIIMPFTLVFSKY